MANRNPEADAAKDELNAHMAVIRKRKQDELLLNIGQVDSSDNEEEEPELAVEGENTGQRAYSAAMQISNNLYKATKSMDKCFKSNAKQMAAVVAASKQGDTPTPARKKTRWDQEDSKEKEDGKEAKPSPFAYVVGENPEVATDSMGKNKFIIHVQ
jgi:hypothetical protein